MTSLSFFFYLITPGKIWKDSSRVDSINLWEGFLVIHLEMVIFYLVLYMLLLRWCKAVAEVCLKWGEWVFFSPQVNFEQTNKMTTWTLILNGFLSWGINLDSYVLISQKCWEIPVQDIWLLYTTFGYIKFSQLICLSVLILCSKKFSYSFKSLR